MPEQHEDLAGKIPPGLQFVLDGALLSFRGPVRDDDWELIPDLATARSRARDQSEEFPIWSDLREHVAVESGTWRTEPGLGQQVQELVFAFTPWPLSDLEDDIIADLTHAATDQLRGQSGECLYPMLLEAYAAGGWPCGWAGMYPDGKLCVYWPPQPLHLPEPPDAHFRRLAYQKERAREKLLRISEPRP